MKKKLIGLCTRCLEFKMLKSQTLQKRKKGWVHYLVGRSRRLRLSMTHRAEEK